MGMLHAIFWLQIELLERCFDIWSIKIKATNRKSNFVLFFIFVLCHTERSGALPFVRINSVEGSMVII